MPQYLLAPLAPSAEGLALLMMQVKDSFGTCVCVGGGGGGKGGGGGFGKRGMSLTIG